jgi:DNA-binding GntR family transcriptional regulator
VTPQEIAEALREGIRAGAFTPGQELVQERLATQLGTSRIPVREGLRLLAAEGLVVLQQGLGAYVNSLRADELNELYELRLRLEPPLAHAIVRNLHQNHLEHFAKAVESMEGCGDTDRELWSSLNFTFHHDMYRVAQRSHTFRIIAQLLNLVEPYSRMYVHRLAARDRAEAEHRRMISALTAHDAPRLEIAIRDHLEGARDRLTEAVEQNSDGVIVPGVTRLPGDQWS